MIYRLGLIGHPVSHSLSPAMHSAALQHCGLEGSYELIDVASEDLERRLSSLTAAGYVGFNVTIPHKLAVYSMSSERTREAEIAQACNTVTIRASGDLSVHNTDISGFASALADSLETRRPARVCVIGNGGAAKAALVALAQFDTKSILVLGRDEKKVSVLTSDMSRLYTMTSHLVALRFEDLTDQEFDLVINCSPIGLNGAELPGWAEPLIDRVVESGLIFDMVYSKTERKTALVEQSEKKRRRAVDGTEMLIRQAHGAFQFWTAQSPPVEVFRQALQLERKAAG